MNNQSVTSVTALKLTTMSLVLEVVHVIHQVCMSYVEAVLASTGVICNVIIVAVFCRAQAAKVCGKSTRLYYVTIAASDLLNIFDMQFFISFLDYGLEYLTNFAFHPGYVARVNDTMCKIFWYPYFVSEQLSGYTLIAFSMERLYAVYFPMRVKAVWAYSRVRIGLALLVAVVLLWNVHIIVSVQRLVTPGTASYVTCLPNTNSAAQVVLFWITYGIVNYGLPTLLVFIINVFILLRIANASRRRSAMITSEQNNAESLKQKVATVSLVLIACIHAVIFLPAACLLTFEALVYIGLVPLSATDLSILVQVAYIAFHFTGISKILNFFVYYFRVPYFSETLRNCFACVSFRKE